MTRFPGPALHAFALASAVATASSGSPRLGAIGPATESVS